MLYCNNKSTISIAHNQHEIIKHIEMDRHFIKEKLHYMVAWLAPHVSTQNQLANILTKGLSCIDF